MPLVSEFRRVDPDPWVFQTVAEMRLGPNPVHLSIAALLGSAAAYDGVLNGVYSFDKNSVLADNGTTVIQPTGVTTGRWRQVIYCPPCPDLCSGWADDPFTGPSTAALFTRDGVGNNYLQMLTDTALGFHVNPAATPFTVGCWVKFNSLTSLSALMTRWSGGGNEVFFLAYDGVQQQFQFYVKDASNNTSAVAWATLPSPAVVGTWYLVCGAFDIVNSKLRIWVNGVQDNVAHGTGIHSGAFDGMVIGQHGGPGSLFGGVIETAFLHIGMVWGDTAMSVLYNAGLGVRANRWYHFGLPIPTAIWEFEDGTNVGKNFFNNADYSMTNNNSAGGAAGLVTLTAGLNYS